MSFLVGLLTSLGTSLLKIFLSGLFNTVLQKIQDDAQHKVEAAQAHEQSVQESAQTEIAIAQHQAQVQVDYSKPSPAGDPFRTDQWNKAVK